MPGKIVKSMDELIMQIKNKQNSEFDEFNQKWNTYNDGRSIKRLIQHIKELL